MDPITRFVRDTRVPVSESELPGVSCFLIVSGDSTLIVTYTECMGRITMSERALESPR